LGGGVGGLTKYVTTNKKGLQSQRFAEEHADVYYNGLNITHFLGPLTTKSVISFSTDAHHSLLVFCLHHFTCKYFTSFSTPSHHFNVGLTRSHSTFRLPNTDFLSQPCFIHSDHIPQPLQSAPLISARYQMGCFV